MPTFKIDNHLIIPFGCPKWGINRIKVSGVSTKATFFQSESPIAYIDGAKGQPLRISDIQSLLPEQLPGCSDDAESFDRIRDRLKSLGEIGTDFERRFIDLYFEQVKACVTRPPGTTWSWPPYDNPRWIFGALIPLPQAHLYMEDPLADGYSFEPQRMVRVDFAFWTGTKLVAVEIDGASHVGDRDHVTRDRMLQRAGVQVVHILNDELLEHGAKAVRRLLPAPFFSFWKWERNKSYVPWNPISTVDDIPF